MVVSMEFKGRDFLTLFDFNKDTLNNFIDFAIKLKQENKEGKEHPILKNKTLAMILAKPSLGIRVGFEVGIAQLGGRAVIIKEEEINPGMNKTIADTARILARYADGVMITSYAHKELEEFAKYSEVPVINALTDICHPCQVLADLVTIKEKFGSFEGLKLAYFGDGNNMAYSLLAGCSIMGIDISIACPNEYEPDVSCIWKCKDISIASGSKIEVLENPEQTAKEANILYTDVWGSIKQDKTIQKIFMPYQVNESLMQNVADNSIVLHSLPVCRGEEITDDVFEKHADIIFEQVENRLHAKKAVLASIM